MTAKSDFEKLVDTFKKAPAHVQKAAVEEWDFVYHGRFKSAIRQNPLTAVWYAAGAGAAVGLFVMGLIWAAF